jgi:hypothetical protein
MSRRRIALSFALCAVLAAATAAGCSKDEGLKITGIEPKTGDLAGGQVVTITGSGFQSGGTRGVKVYFGNRSAKIRGFSGDDELRVEAPGGKEGEVVDIEIIFDDSRRNKITKAFKYINTTPIDIKDFDKEKLKEKDK